MAAGLVLASLFGAAAEAQGPTSPAGLSRTQSLEGRWVMARDRSFFEERVSGPAPDKTIVTVVRDSPDRLIYDVSESRAGEEVAHGAYNLSLTGSLSRSVVDGARQTLKAARSSDGAVIATAAPVAGYTALIRLRSTGPNTAVLEHEVESASGPIPVDQITLIRSVEAAR
jgi:hypothetical protein